MNIFTVGEIFEKVIRQFDVIKEFLDDKLLDVRSKRFEVLDVVWDFMSSCHPDKIQKYKDFFKKLINTICSLPPLLYQFMLNETLVLHVFQKCFNQEKKIIIFYLMENLYKRIQFIEDDDNLDAELRKRVFHCLRRYTETIKLCFEDHEKAFGCKVFSFIVRFYTTLFEESHITEFERFFESKSKLNHHESIFVAKVFQSY